MGITQMEWAERIAGSTDLSAYLTHLTKKTDSKSAVQVLVEIVRQQKLALLSESASARQHM